MKSNTLVQKFWTFCNTLRDDGMGYGDYLEQLTYLLFLKLAYEFSEPPNSRNIFVPSGYGWANLRKETGASLQDRYRKILARLSKEDGMLGAIFYKAENKIQDPAKLSRLVQMIDAERWLNLEIDLKGDLYEGLLKKNAEDSKSGAGQYFTPRPLIEAIVACVQPKPMRTIADPACGTGGFFLGVLNWLNRSDGRKLSKKELDFLRSKAFFGNEIVPATRRMCLMNLFLHGIGDMVTKPPIDQADALLRIPPQKFDYVLANPPFGNKSSMKFTNARGNEETEDLTYLRSDFWETTSNKQLNFVQHIALMLKETGEAAVVVPDNVLFEGGVGERIRRRLMKDCDVHTILRLPKSGIFYANGVKANVLFWRNRPSGAIQPNTKGIWIYDLRSDQHFTLKTKPLSFSDLADFVDCYRSESQGARLETTRFKYFTYEEICARDKASWDISLNLRNDASLETLPAPEELQRQIIMHLESALLAFRRVETKIRKT